MMFSSPIPKSVSPKYHEASTQRSIRDSDGVGKAWVKSKKEQSINDSLARAVSQNSREIQKLKRRIVGGGTAVSGWHKPKNKKYEVDPTYAYNEGSVIHIQPTNSLVTTGIRDAANPTGGLVTSCAGFWVAIQDVPAKSIVSGNEVWHLPQYPLPVETDLDDETNYWLYLGEAMSC